MTQTSAMRKHARDCLKLDASTLEYLGLEPDEFEEGFFELDETDKAFCLSMIADIAAQPDAEKKKAIYDMLGLVPDEEVEDVLSNWELISYSL